MSPVKVTNSKLPALNVHCGPGIYSTEKVPFRHPTLCYYIIYLSFFMVKNSCFRDGRGERRSMGEKCTSYVHRGISRMLLNSKHFLVFFFP